MQFCRSFDSFKLDASLKIILVYFFLVTRSISICCFWGLVAPLFCSLMPKVMILSFWSEIVKRLFGATHVFGRNFTFCNFGFIGGALNLLRHVVELSVSLTPSWPVEITWKLSMSRLDFLVLVLQSSNGFHPNSLSFQVFSSLTLTVYEGHDRLIPVGFFVFHWFFLEGRD